MTSLLDAPGRQPGVDSPKTDDASPSGPADRGGTAQLRFLMTRGRPDPETVRSVVDAHPGERAEMMALLHATFGNGFVQEVMAASDVAGELRGDASDIGGLFRGNGMTAQTASLRPRVMELQRRLNAAMDAGLKIDGMFGPLTGRATREFQASIRQPSEEYVTNVTADALYGDAPPDHADGASGPGGPRGEPDANALTGAATAGSELATAMQTTSARLDRASAAVGSMRIFGAAPALQGASNAAREGEGPARDLGNAFARAAGGSEAPQVIGNPLVGLTLRDGMTPGTRDRRPRVERLQTALNQAGSYGLVVDGKFGPDTASALAGYRSERSLVHQDAVDADTADHLLGQEAHTPERGNADAARLDAAGELLSTAGSYVLAGAGQMRAAGDELVRTEATDGSLGATSESVAEMAKALDKFSALRGAQFGPVGLAARQQLRELVGTTSQLASSVYSTGIGIETAAPALTVPEPSGASASLANAGALVSNGRGPIEAAGQRIAPVGPTGGGKRG